MFPYLLAYNIEVIPLLYLTTLDCCSQVGESSSVGMEMFDSSFCSFSLLKESIVIHIIRLVVDVRLSPNSRTLMFRCLCETNIDSTLIYVK